MPNFGVKQHSSDSNKAFVTILNGVLLNVMPEISVAFALAALTQVPPKDRTPNLLMDLINFGFSKSGISCLDKMHLFNQENPVQISSPNQGADLYDTIKTFLTAEATFVDGFIDFLKNLKNKDIPTFTTSVVKKDALDKQMQSSPQGRQLMPVLTEALGADGEYTKLAGHLRYIQQRYTSIKSFVLLFDAPLEIELGQALRDSFEVRLFGFVNSLSSRQINQALIAGIEHLKQHQLTEKYHIEPDQLLVDLNKLTLPSVSQSEQALLKCGADEVITYKDRSSIQSLENLF